MTISPFGWKDFNKPAVSARNLEAMLASAGAYTDSATASVVSTTVLSPGSVSGMYIVDFKHQPRQNIIVNAILTGDTTVKFINLAAACEAELLLSQDGVGGHLLSVSDGTVNSAVSINTSAGSSVAVQVNCPNGVDLYVNVVAGNSGFSGQVIRAGNLGSSYTLDFGSQVNLPIMLVGTLNANVTVTVTNRAAGCQAVFLLAQDGTGGRSFTISDGSTSQAVSGLSTVAGATDLVEIWCPDASNVYVAPITASATAEDVSRKDQPNGYPSLDGTGRIPVGELPTSAMTQSVADGRYARTFATTYLLPTGGDDSAAMQTALDAGGLIVMGPGTYLWNTQVPAFKRSTPTRVACGGATIKLSSGAPRAFDFNKVNDNDTFRDIEITDLTVDCNNVGGRHHVVLGTYVNGGNLARINILNLAIRRIRTINVPSDPTLTNHRLNIYMVVLCNQADTQCNINDVIFEDLDFMHGGNMGVSMGGTTNDGSGDGHLFHDRIYLTRVNHDVGTPIPRTTVNGAAQTIDTTPRSLTVASTASLPTASQVNVAGVTGAVTYTGVSGGNTLTGCTVASGSFTATNGGPVIHITYASENIQIGSRDTGGTVTIRDCHGFNSGDVGIAVLNGRSSLVEGCTTTDPRNAGFQAGNFNPNMARDQTHTFRDCHGKIVSLQPDGVIYGSPGFTCGGAPSQQLGHVLLDGCTFDSLSPVMGGLGQSVQLSSVPVAKLTIRDFTYTQRVVNWTLLQSRSAAGVYINPIAGAIPLIVTVDNLKTDIAGAVTPGGFTYGYTDVLIVPGTNCEVQLDGRAHHVNYNITGVPNSTFTAVSAGVASAPGTTTVTATTTNTSATLSSVVPAYGITRGNFVSGTGLTTNSGIFSTATNGTAATMTTTASISNTGVAVTVTPFAVIFGNWKIVIDNFDGSDAAPNGAVISGIAGAIGGAIVSGQTFSIPPMEGLHFDGSDFGKFPSGSGSAQGASGNVNKEIQPGGTNTLGFVPLVLWHGAKLAGNRTNEANNNSALANGATTIQNTTGRSWIIWLSVAATVVTIANGSDGQTTMVPTSGPFFLPPGAKMVVTTAGGTYYRFPAPS